MKSILAISGSASKNSSNSLLLQTLSKEFAASYYIEVYEGLWNFPIFTPQLQGSGKPKSVKEFCRTVATADSVIISTPEYLHNIPAVLKNALEWMTESGELTDKPVLPITFTPAAPRGEHAMQSLLQSLKASKAKIVTELPLFQNQLRTDKGEIELNEDFELLIREALALL